MLLWKVTIKFKGCSFTDAYDENDSCRKADVQVAKCHDASLPGNKLKAATKRKAGTCENTYMF